MGYKADPEQVEKLKQGVEAWNSWRAENPEKLINLGGVNLRGIDLNVTGVGEVNLQGAILKDADLRGAKLFMANLENVDLRGANLENAEMEGAYLKGTNLYGANLYKANLRGANLCSSTIRVAYLSDANLDGANLTNAAIRSARFINTRIKDLVFDSDHKSFYDESDKIILKGFYRRINWSTIRIIGNLPLFGVSYAALGLSLALISSVDFINTNQIFTNIEYPIPIPHRISLVLISSILLAIGSTMYKTWCPERIQTFSETEWVEQHGHPRLMYFSSSWGSKMGILSTLIFTGFGGILAIYLIIERIIIALAFLFNEYGRVLTDMLFG